jgi:hypothetical protein
VHNFVYPSLAAISSFISVVTFLSLFDLSKETFCFWNCSYGMGLDHFRGTVFSCLMPSLVANLIVVWMDAWFHLCGSTIPSCVYCHSKLVGDPESGSPAGLFFKLLWYPKLPEIQSFVMNSRSDLKREVFNPRCFWGEGYWDPNYWLLAPKLLTIGPNLGWVICAAYLLKWRVCKNPFILPVDALNCFRIPF